jgi:hypothetical protein
MMRSAVLTGVCVLLAGCSHEEGAKPRERPVAADHERGPHGGHILEVGDHVAHLEIVHDEAAGRVTLYVLGDDAKTPMPIAKAPEFKLTTKDGPRVIATAPEGAGSGESATFVVVDEVLKGFEPEGRISVEIGGRQYNPELAHDD